MPTGDRTRERDEGPREGQEGRLHEWYVLRRWFGEAVTEAGEALLTRDVERGVRTTRVVRQLAMALTALEEQL